MNNLSSNCGLIDSRMGASEKDLPVMKVIIDVIFPSEKENDLGFLTIAKCNGKIFFRTAH